MSKLKSRKLAVFCCAIALVFTCSISAFAAECDYYFEFNGTGAITQDSNVEAKAIGDTNQYALLTISGSDNWNKGVDRVYCWVKAGPNYADYTNSNFYRTNYCTNVKLPYTSHIYELDTAWLRSWHNSSSSNFSVGGTWSP